MSTNDSAPVGECTAYDLTEAYESFCGKRYPNRKSPMRSALSDFVVFLRTLEPEGMFSQDFLRTDAGRILIDGEPHWVALLSEEDHVVHVPSGQMMHFVPLDSTSVTVTLNNDPELEAMAIIRKAFEPLTFAEQRRAIEWAHSLFAPTDEGAVEQ